MLKFFHNLRVGQKLALISVFFVIPDTLLLCLFLFNINSNIRFAQLERFGNAYQRPLQELLELLPEHWIQGERRRWGDPQASDRIVELESGIDEAFDRLMDVDRRLGTELQFTPEGLAKRGRSRCQAGLLKEEWNTLRDASWQADAKAARTGHDGLLTRVREMITHAGDNSNLILDPDLDSYYLMDVTLLALPEMQTRLAETRRYGEALLSAAGTPWTPPSSADQRDLAVHAAMLQRTDLDRVSASTRTALREDTNFYGFSETLQTNLPPAIARFEAAQNRFIRLVSALSSSGSAPCSLAEFQIAGEQASRSSFELWRVAVKEVDALLDRRMGHFRGQRNKSLVASSMAFCCAFLFVSFITRSISGPLQQQARELRLSNGALQAEIVERRRAEDALRVAEERFRGIFENAVEGIFQTTPEGEYIVANRTLIELYGYDSFEELQTSVRDIRSQVYVDPGQRERFRALIEAQGVVARFESQVYRKDRSVIWISENARAVHAADGTLLCYEGTVEDITARKLAELELAKVHRQLLDASRMAGKAEIATSILHNVGNVLHRVNMSVQLLADGLGRLKVAQLQKLVEMLTAQGDQLGRFLVESPKGRMVPRYLGEFAEHLGTERDALSGEIALLRKHLEHLKRIVASQQSHAKAESVVEEITASELLEEAIQLNGDPSEASGIRVVRDYRSNPRLLLDRHKALQILVNLIRNAQQACDASGGPERRLTLSIGENAGRAEFGVIDNGVGIAPDDLTRIFQHGFTTRADGHGFGLHSGAIAARELGGALRVTSEGRGRGAAFVLELPTRGHGQGVLDA